MSLFAREKWTWKFACPSDADYELDMTFTVQDSFFMKVYSKGVHHFARAHGKTAHGNPALVDEFDIDESFLPKVKVYVSKPFAITAQDVYKQSGRYLVNYNVANVHYKRQDKEWLMTVKLKGVYSRK